MTLSAFAIQVTTMLALTPEDFATIEPRNGTEPDDYRVVHEKLGSFVLHRWLGVVHRGAYPTNYQPGGLMQARDMISARRLSLRDGWHLRKHFEIWARRAMDLSPRTREQGATVSVGIPQSQRNVQAAANVAQRSLMEKMRGQNLLVDTATFTLSAQHYAGNTGMLGLPGEIGAADPLAQMRDVCGYTVTGTEKT